MISIQPKTKTRRGPCRGIKGSVAFEYVMVTLLGMGISIMLMQLARKIIHDKLDTLQQDTENSASFDDSWDHE